MSRKPNRFDRRRWYRRLASGIEAAQLRRWGWAPTTVIWRIPVLVLVTRGRRTGTTRETPLSYLAEGESLFVAGGAVGQTRTPDWVANLRSDEACEVIIDRRRRQARAIELSGGERDERWRLFVERWPRLRSYEGRAGRTIPLFRLDPSQGTG